MSRKKNISGRKDERGVVITLVAIFMLFVVGAMAALSIDVVTIYTARSEAQLAADGAALAAARVIANSGATSDATGTGTLLASVEAAAGPAQNVAVQVAEQNQVGGTYLTPANIITPLSFGGTTANPTVTVKVQVTNLPTFFARIWGTKFITVAASATAEAYNPSSIPGTTSIARLPVAPKCVKPWLLPNIDPNGGTTIFDPSSGTITDPDLLGWTSSSVATQLYDACPNGDCSGILTKPAAWRYYPGDPTTTFQPPTQALPSCTPVLTTDYEKSIGGCVQTALACNQTANIDFSNYGTRNHETAEAANCLTHAKDGGDTVTSTAPPSTPFEFVAGAGNPIPGASGNDVMVSDSLVTVPVYDSGNNQNPPTNPVTIVGFVQLFLDPNGQPTPTFGAGRGLVNTTIINMAGCGTGATGQPILGNGASPVAVRLISPP